MIKIEIIDWKEKNLSQLERKYQMTRKEIYFYAVKHKLYKHPTKIEVNRFSDAEKEFLEKNQNLTVSQVATIFHKSYNATLMYIKLQGYYNMIAKRKNNL